MKEEKERSEQVMIDMDLDSFMGDVDNGLSAVQKNISSKYFYDDDGSRIFQQIMEMPEYYLTNCELEILTYQSKEILSKTGFKRHFNIIELGAGDGVKTLELLKSGIEMGLDFTYIPIDISSEAINQLENKLLTVLPQLKIESKIGDYFEMIQDVSKGDSPSLVLFMGANIGNYSQQDAKHLLVQIREHLKANDQLLIGFDLQKNPAQIALAYNDPKGITKAFNLNLLSRMNRELGANFDLSQFDFYSHYNPLSGVVNSYLISLCDQEVHFDYNAKSYTFEKNELLYTEQSRKYSLGEIGQLSNDCSFRVHQNFTDTRGYFVDSLWSVV